MNSWLHHRQPTRRRQCRRASNRHHQARGQRLDSKSSTGLLGEYFDGPEFTSRFLNRVDSTVNFDLGAGAP